MALVLVEGEDKIPNILNASNVLTTVTSSSTSSPTKIASASRVSNDKHFGATVALITLLVTMSIVFP
jgi:hypothetical protein